VRAGLGEGLGVRAVASQIVVQR